MTHQPSLFDPSEITPHVPELIQVEYRSETLAERFEEFHEANPAVYRNLRAIALDIRRRGIQNFSIAAIFERLRWIYKFQTVGDDYKLNNSWRAFYARMLMEREPELVGFFETRTQKSVEEN